MRDRENRAGKYILPWQVLALVTSWKENDSGSSAGKENTKIQDNPLLFFAFDLPVEILGG